jgi:hypothetical protein
MSIKMIKPYLWLLDVRVIKGSKKYRQRLRVQGGIKANAFRKFL